MDALKIEEMEKLLKEAHLEKARLLESKVRSEPGICGCGVKVHNIVVKENATCF